MAVNLSVVPIYVSDQQAALEFYTAKLGMEKRMDDPMGPDLRWITVALPGDQVEFVLAAGFGHADPDSQVGNMGGYVLRTDDCRATHEQWSAAGVDFTEPPTEQFWGIQALFQDPDGNDWVLLERPEGM